MTLQAMTTALYEHYGRWRLIAEACEEHGAEPHSAGYYQQIATGRIKTPDAATVQSIASVFSAFSAPRRRAARKTVHFSLDVSARLEAVKLARGLTWDATLERAAQLLEEEVPNG